MSHVKATFDNCAVITVVPAFSRTILDQIVAVIKSKISSRFAAHGDQNVPEIDMKPILDETQGKCLAFIAECKSVGVADALVGRLHNVRIAKSTELHVYHWSDFRILDEAEAADDDDDDGVEVILDQSNPFMSDKACRPQLLVRTSNKLQWNWVCNPTLGATNILQPIPVEHIDEAPKNMLVSQHTPIFSPKGTYLVTLPEPKRMSLYGGKKSDLLADFRSFSDIKYIQVSPAENYLVTYDSEFMFWDVNRMKLLQRITGDVTQWPVYQYNADDSLVATFRPSIDASNAAVRGHSPVMLLKIYHAASMTQLMLEASSDKLATTSIAKNAVPGSFSWSPSSPNLFTYTLDDNSSIIGPQVVIESVAWEAREERGTTVYFCTLSEVARFPLAIGANLHVLWHPQGTYLAAKITDKANAKQYRVLQLTQSKSAFVQLESFEGYSPERFAWQPYSSRFAIILTALAGLKASQIAFCEILSNTRVTTQRLNTAGELLFWAPRGNRCVAVNRSKSMLEFYGIVGAGAFPGDQPMTLIATVQHFLVTHIEWDPTGRFLCSYTSMSEHPTDNAFIIWDINGNKLHESSVSRLSHCMWRPLAASLLTPEHLEKIKRSFPDFVAQYKEKENEKKAKQEAVDAAKQASILNGYIKKMNDIHADAVANGIADRRAALIAKSPSWKRNMELLSGMNSDVQQND